MATRSTVRRAHRKTSSAVCLLGVDLAWGDRKPDGLCAIEYTRRRSRVLGFAYPHGDEAFAETLERLTAPYTQVFVTVDAPIVCPNTTGTRPVDRLTHRMFHREHAACHPANSTKCPRPIRIRRRLERMGYRTGWELTGSGRFVAEVYPHPAMVRLFRLNRIVKYKKGRVVERSREFARLQRLLHRLIRDEFPRLALGKEATTVLRLPWSKRVEDQLDALFCALIGLWHVTYRGRRSEVIGDLRTGFILLPEDLRSPPNM